MPLPSVRSAFRPACRAARCAVPGVALLAALTLGLAACGGGSDADGGGSLVSLTQDGTPGVGGSGAARSSSGHYFVRVGDAAGTALRLSPGANRWEAYGTGYGAPSAAQYDGSMYLLGPGGGTLMQVSGADYVPVIGVPGVGATFLAKTEDGRLHMVTSFLASPTTTSVTFWSALPTDTTWRNDGGGVMPTAQLWMTSQGRVIGWRRGFGLVQVNPANAAQTTLLACGQPGLTTLDCAESILAAVPDRRGQLYHVSVQDGNAFQVELWQLAAGSNAPVRVAGPSLPKLPQGDGASNYYRPGGASAASLYADPGHRIWMSFRWGNNNANDTSYLYRYEGAGWTHLRGDLSRNVILFGEGAPPGILGINLFGAMQVWVLN
jgi:hypothetical protein